MIWSLRFFFFEGIQVLRKCHTAFYLVFCVILSPDCFLSGTPHALLFFCFSVARTLVRPRLSIFSAVTRLTPISLGYRDPPPFLALLCTLHSHFSVMKLLSRFFFTNRIFFPSLFKIFLLWSPFTYFVS